MDHNYKKYALKKIILVGGDYTLQQISEEFNKIKLMNIDMQLWNPSFDMPKTQSEFFMPLITFAYCIIKIVKENKHICENSTQLYQSIGKVVTILQIDDRNISERIFKGMILAIINYLNQNDNLSNL